MALSKSTRISILLAIDSAFFLLELSVGYAVHSLALVADAFHMLNDVLSLCVGLWAVKVAQRKTSSQNYTYGWQRAETLGALINGVFLVALCLSIFLEAIQRFVEPQIVTNPKLVLIVGCLGLASNFVGLFLFHDHGHSHGGHSHAPSRDAEQGLTPSDRLAADETGNVADVLPENRLGSWPHTENSTTPNVAADRSRHTQKRRSGRSRSRTFSNVEDMPVKPSSIRRSIISASRKDPVDSDGDGDGDTHDDVVDESTDDDHRASSGRPLLRSNGHGYGSVNRDDHKAHTHAKPKSSADGHGGHGHSHGDLNMRGVFLHVMGDALGNIGVIVAALLIWLTKFPWRYYFDPAVSLVITVIILLSAIPLCKAASRILLQAVPDGLSVDDLKEDIQGLPGVVSCHHMHVWQLSDTKLIASLHIQVAYSFEGEGSARYMQLARAVRGCLHEYGIHSATIQPEFCLDPHHDHARPSSADATANVDGAAEGSRKNASGTASGANPCLLECADECGKDSSCCPPPGDNGTNSKGSNARDDQHGHAH